ncbi:MAG: aminopeptidase P family protein [Gemmatimonadetes bacterium]|nr:aminopeptidase P family protein [Gemmatimonadota bacterium]
MRRRPEWSMFPEEEHRARTERARALLERHQLDAMVLFSPTNWRYYGGFTDAAQMHNGVWRSCLIVCRERDPVALVHAGFEACIVTMSHLEDVRVWADQDSPISHGRPNSFYPLFFRTLEELGLSRGRLGFETGSEIDTYLPFDELAMIRERLSSARIVSADAAIWAQRSIKTPWEQGVIREGARLACECTRAAFEAIRPGANELDVHRAYWGKAAELGMIEAPYRGTWTCFTSNRDEPTGLHRWITGPLDRAIRHGDQGVSDGGPSYKGYQFDFQRTFHVGEPPEKMLRYHRIATEAHLETISMVKPGVRMRDLFAGSLEALRKRGYYHPHVISFIGHQEGLSHHEPPWVMASEDAVVQAGMVMAIEIGAFDPDFEVLGSMPEDLLLVTDDGTEMLTSSLPHELWIAG